MKIAFVGKGGSGKTTLSSLYVRHLASKNVPVLAVDADINQHMGEALGMTEAEQAAVAPLDKHFSQLQAYVRGTNGRISENRFVMKTTPPGSGSGLIRFETLRNELSDLAADYKGILFTRTGPLTEDDIGLNCFHGKVSAVEVLLNHLVEDAKEHVVVDMTAGADSFSSGMFTKFDVTFIVVEPTLKSLGVFKQYLEHADKYGLKLHVIGNKVEDESDLAFLRQHVGDYLFGYVGRSAFVRAMERGDIRPIEELEPENSKVLARMQTEVEASTQDLDKLYRQAVDFHVLNATTWMNARAGIDLTKQVDPEFSLEAAARG